MRRRWSLVAMAAVIVCGAWELVCLVPFGACAHRNGSEIECVANRISLHREFEGAEPPSVEGITIYYNAENKVTPVKGRFVRFYLRFAGYLFRTISSYNYLRPERPNTKPAFELIWVFDVGVNAHGDTNVVGGGTSLVVDFDGKSRVFGPRAVFCIYFSGLQISSKLALSGFFLGLRSSPISGN